MFALLVDGDVVNVDGDRSTAAVGRSIGVSPVDEVAGREHQAAERLGVASVVGDHRVAVDWTM